MIHTLYEIYYRALHCHTKTNNCFYMSENLCLVKGITFLQAYDSTITLQYFTRLYYELPYVGSNSHLIYIHILKILWTSNGLSISNTEAERSCQPKDDHELNLKWDIRAPEGWVMVF